MKSEELIFCAQRLISSSGVLLWRRWWLDEEEVQTERGVSRAREGALCLDIMKKQKTESGIQNIESSPDTGRRGARGHANWKTAARITTATGLRWQEAVARHVFCRVGSVFYRIIYRILPPPGRFLPPVAASYRIRFFLRIKHSRILVRRMIGRGMGQAEPAWEMESSPKWITGTMGAGSGEHGILRKKITHFSTVFHDFTHRSGP
jgi:hypothetical protein